MSASGFKVFMADLQHTVEVFAEQSGTLSAVMPADGPAAPDGGSAAVNDALQGAAQLLGLLHTQLAAAISQHADRLQAAHTRYAHAENKLSKLAYDITNPGTV